MSSQATFLNPQHLVAVLQAINRAPFFMHMSMKVVELDVGYSKVIGIIEKDHMNPFGGLHGGVYSAIIDTAAYWASYCDLPEEQGLVSIDLKVDFLGPVIGPEVTVTGKRIKAGKTIYLAEASMFCENGKLVAHGTSKLMAINNMQTINDVAAYLSTGCIPPKFIGERRAV